MHGHNLDMNKLELEIFLMTELWDPGTDFQKKQYKHKIIECLGLEGTFRGHLAQQTCSEQGHL